jgi:shikimate dehydrogenase
MERAVDWNRIQNLITNRITIEKHGDKLIAGIIGDGPSHYSKSPALWNAAFAHLGIDAGYFPFDVGADNIGALLKTLRHSDNFLGLNVTVPHKVCVMDFLDELDPGAARIQAVNTIVRTPAGKLIGCNTDGEGFIESLLTPQPGRQESFRRHLGDLDVLMLGAGGAARAVAFHLSDHMERGTLAIANRTLPYAAALAEEIVKLGRKAIGVTESDIPIWANRAGLIVNCTTKGQGGVRKLAGGMATILEPYSALAPADPPALPENFTGTEAFASSWYQRAAPDIERNNRASSELARTIPTSSSFYDLIYHPEETVFLRHGRSTGHQTMNGKSMIVCQAAIAMAKRICRQQIVALGIDEATAMRQITEVMYRAW